MIAGLWPFIGDVSLRADGGASGSVGDGYLSLNDALPNQESLFIFKDLEQGLVVAAFKIEADVRLGGGTAEPAEGFSFNYAAINDPLIESVNAGGTGIYQGWSGTLNEPGRDHGQAGNGLPEEGTATGLAIGFDLVASGPMFPPNDGEDLVGISIKVDGNLIAQFPVPLRPGNVQAPGSAPGSFTADEVPYRNLAVDNPNYLFSLQTGALNPDRVDGSGDNESWKNLKWERFTVEVTDTAKVLLSWKGVELTPPGGLATPFTPSAGRLIFGSRTGAGFQNHHIDNIKVTTVGATHWPIEGPSGFAYGFTVPFSNSGQSIVDESSIVIKLNGQVVPGTAVTRDGLVRWTSEMLSPLLPSDSTANLEIHSCDTRGRCLDQVKSFKVPVYATVPASLKLAADATGDGFNVAMRQVESRNAERALSPRTWDDNWISVAEQQVSGGFGDNLIDENTSGPGGKLVLPNPAAPTPYINWDQASGANGNFTDAATIPRPDNPIPGIPGLATGPDENITAAITTYLKLDAGYHRMGVNSDDGFTVRAGLGQFGPLLGSFNGGRGASDSIFDFVVEVTGWYPFRLSWWEGGGGANLEWFSQDLVTGEKIPINDNSVAGFVDAAPNGAGPSYVKWLNPYDGFTAAAPDSIKALLVSGTPAIDAGSIAMKVDGVAAAVTTSGAGEITVTHTPSPKLAFNSAHSLELSYTVGGEARTVNTTFRVRSAGPADFSGNVFLIEAEDFDSNGVQVAGTDAMPFTPGGANGLGATRYVDYNHYNEPNGDGWANGVDGGTGYRNGEGTGGTSFNVPMDSNTSGPLDTQRAGSAGVYEVASNFKLGWAGESDGQVNWLNFTRTIPQGNYKVWAAFSHGEANPNQLRGLLHKVTSGVGTTTQAKTLLGVFNAPGTGGWGHNALVPMVGVDLQPAVVTLGGKTTLRFDYPTGDFDYFFLVPTTDPATSQLAATAGSFVIEAEDFNHSSGQIEAAVNTMPYLGGAYQGKSAVDNVDYHRTNDEQAEAATYRVGEVPNVPMNREFDGERDRNRGSYEVTNNWKIGWAGDHWYNYTRNIPNGAYNVYASLSHGDGPSNLGGLAGKLELVNDGTSASQLTASLGTFLAPGTGGWGNSYLVPMMKNGTQAAYQISGNQTLRMTVNNGDFDYFVLVPTAAGEALPTFGGGAPTLSISLNAATGEITVTFTGTLEVAETPDGPYVPQPTLVSPYKFTPGTGDLYARARN